jgi:hypothetical protein
VECESIAIYFNKSCPPEFDLETSGSNTILSYYASTSYTQKLKLMGKGVQFTYTSIVAFTSWACTTLSSSLPKLFVRLFENFYGGDLSEHIGSTRVGFDGVHMGFGYGSRNQEGDGVLNFFLAYNLIVVNILFRKRVLSSNL